MELISAKMDKGYIIKLHKRLSDVRHQEIAVSICAHVCWFLAGVELISFTVTDMGLCFGFALNTGLIT